MAQCSGPTAGGILFTVSEDPDLVIHRSRIFGLIPPLLLFSFVVPTLLLLPGAVGACCPLVIVIAAI